MRFIYCILAAALLVAACKKDRKKPTACNVENPVANLPWLKHAIDSFVSLKQGGSVTLVSYRGEDYINIQQNIISCWPCGLHTCAGKRLFYPGDSALISDITRNGEPKVIHTFGE
ncbi:hypothetical protein AB6805_14155 [Chitinophaga sp. RCC_12]|uniref:hypothetical protein n=1 Tax=Chitinophaga sp. RCC_12 TaxID=3239226 RepID=UPI003523DA74